MPAVDKSVVRLLRVVSICFGLFWLPWPYLPRSDLIRSHSAPAVRDYESRVLCAFKTWNTQKMTNNIIFWLARVWTYN